MTCEKSHIVKLGQFSGYTFASEARGGEQVMIGTESKIHERVRAWQIGLVALASEIPAARETAEAVAADMSKALNISSAGDALLGQKRETLH